MRRVVLLFVLALVGPWLAVGGAQAAPTPTPSTSPTPRATATPTTATSAAPTPEATPSATPRTAEPRASIIDAKYRALGGESGFLGRPTTNEICGLKDGGCFRGYQGGADLLDAGDGPPLHPWRDP